MKPVRIYLWSLPAPALIVPRDTRVIYCNQVDGVATVHRELEGFLIPLPACDARPFNPRWWYRHCNRRTAGDADLFNRIADEVEVALNHNRSDELPNNIRVVRSADNVEAWFHVTFDFMGDAVDTRVSERFSGVLTWENCD